MTWTMTDYPDTLRSHRQLVRKKTIELANQLIAAGVPEPLALMQALHEARLWYRAASAATLAAYARL